MGSLPAPTIRLRLKEENPAAAANLRVVRISGYRYRIYMLRILTGLAAFDNRVGLFSLCLLRRALVPKLGCINT